MSKISDAADQLISLADKFRAITDVADVLKQLGSVEQAISERGAALKDAIAKHEEAEADLETVQANLASAQSTHAEMIAKHEREIVALRASADASIEMNFNDAKLRAQSIIDAANEQAAQVQDATNSFLANRRAELDQVQADLSMAQLQLNAVKAERATTEAAIETLKSAAKAVLN